MKHTHFTSVHFFGFGTIALLGACQSQEKEAQLPNIIFIMSDDHAYQAISAPSRAVLLTGKHSFVNGKVDNVSPFDWSQPNFPKLMQASGYQTAMIGKIHLDGIPLMNILPYIW